MVDRQKLLVWLVAGLAAAWLVDQLYFTPWSKEMSKLRQEIDKSSQQIAIARSTLAVRKDAAERWKALSDQLGAPRESDTTNEFVTGLTALSSLVGLRNWSVKVGREQKIGGFVETSIETSFQASWESFVRLLWEIRNWKDFLRVQRISVVSKYEKENRLDVDLRVSTIEAAPTRGGNGK